MLDRARWPHLDTAEAGHDLTSRPKATIFRVCQSAFAFSVSVSTRGLCSSASSPDHGAMRLRVRGQKSMHDRAAPALFFIQKAKQWQIRRLLGGRLFT